MRNFMLAAGFLSVGIAAAAVTPTPAVADPNPLSQGFQEFASAACSSAGDCAIVFPALTKKTVITHTSCEFFLPTGGTLSYASLGEQSSNPRNSLQPYAFASSSNGTNYGVNTDVYLIYTKKQQPRVDVFGYGQPVSNIDCTISGYQP